MVDARSYYDYKNRNIFARSYNRERERPFRRGVEIRVRAPGLAFRGQSNVNEQHTNNPAADFDLVLLEAGYGVSMPSVLTLENLKDANDQFIFDPARLIGPEHHQGTLVRVNNVWVVDSTAWGTNATLTITDDAGRAGLLAFSDAGSLLDAGCRRQRPDHSLSRRGRTRFYKSMTR